MTTPTRFAVDPERLRIWLHRKTPPSGPVFAWWFVRRWIVFSVAFYLIAVLGAAFLDGELSRALHFSGRGLWRNLFLPLVCGLTVNLFTLGTILRLRRKSEDTVAAEIELEWAELVRPQWPLRALGMGLWMGLGIGVPVGALLTFGLPRSEQPSGGPIVVWLSFVAMTLLWTIPAAFLLRWGTLWHYRRLGRPHIAT